jgi:hypothetical protein
MGVNMPEEFYNYVQAAYADFYDGCFYLYQTGSDLITAGQQSIWTSARQYIVNAGNDLRYAAQGWQTGLMGGFDNLNQALLWINNNWGGALTMLQLIAAMSVAMPDEIMTFICLEDAYRAALWDRPYNPEYFATMVRAFKSWQ